MRLNDVCMHGNVGAVHCDLGASSFLPSPSLNSLLIPHYPSSPIIHQVVESTSVLLRGCTVRNTDWAVGLVVNTGRDTKVQGASKEAMEYCHTHILSSVMSCTYTIIYHVGLHESDTHLPNPHQLIT